METRRELSFFFFFLLAGCYKQWRLKLSGACGSCSWSMLNNSCFRQRGNAMLPVLVVCVTFLVRWCAVACGGVRRRATLYKLVTQTAAGTLKYHNRSNEVPNWFKPNVAKSNRFNIIHKSVCCDDGTQVTQELGPWPCVVSVALIYTEGEIYFYLNAVWFVSFCSLPGFCL